jgi:hypothetical protein
MHFKNVKFQIANLTRLRIVFMSVIFLAGTFENRFQLFLYRVSLYGDKVMGKFYRERHKNVRDYGAAFIFG